MNFHIQFVMKCNILLNTYTYISPVHYRMTLVGLIEQLTDGIIDAYEHILDTSDMVEPDKLVITQNRALQLMFDLRAFIATLPRKDESEVSRTTVVDAGGVGGAGTRPPPLPSKKIIKNDDLFFYNFVVKNVFCQYLYSI